MISYPHVAADVKGQQNRAGRRAPLQPGTDLACPPEDCVPHILLCAAEQAARIQHDNEILLRKLQFVARPRPPSIELQYTVK